MAAPSVSTSPGLEWSDWIRSGDWESNADTTVPMLPASAQEIFTLALDPDVTTAQIVALVSKDSVLASRVLQFANSAFSASAREITTVHDAVVRVGTGLVRNVMTSTCMSALSKDVRVYGDQGRNYVDHSLATAHLASLVSERLGQLPSEGFLYGLLHDVGKLLIMKLSRQALRYGIAPPDDDEFGEVLTEMHPGAGGFLMRQWGLPTRLHDPVRWHHEPSRAVDNPAGAAIAYAANRLSHRYGFACAPDDSDLLTDPILLRVGIDAQTLSRFDAKAPTLLELARTFPR